MKINKHISRVAIGASLVLGLTAVHAARGYNVLEGQESQVQIGMSSNQVEAVLGSPSRIVKFNNEPGPIWTYNVVDMSPVEDTAKTVFDVGFGPDGRVVSVVQRHLANVGDGS